MPNLRNDLLLQASRLEPTARAPVWLMRQAGRCDPQYRRLKERCGLPLGEIFRSPDLAAQITLLPMRLGVDAVIIFQDILTPLASMGAEFVYSPAPVIKNPLRAPADLGSLSPINPERELGFVSETIRLVKEKLAGALPVIGFAGAPFTLLTFIAEGGAPRGSAERTRQLLRTAPGDCKRALDLLARMTIDYLKMQIDAGADAIQLFESTAHLIEPDEYDEFAHPYQTEVLQSLAGAGPRILFAKDQNRVELMARTGADVLSVGGCVDLGRARRELGGRVALQGNVSNRLLRDGSPQEIAEAVRRCLEAGGGHGHILNLDHGVLPGTSIENVRAFIDAAKSAPGSEPAASTPGVNCA